jgi:integrase
MLALEWRDVNLDTRVIQVRAMNTKTLTARAVPVSTRLFIELQRLYNERSGEGSVFGIADNFTRSWMTACDKAKIEGLRFHDLRATCATRLISAGMQIAEVAKITGHTQLSTLYTHYIRNTASAVERAASLLDSINV